MIRGHQAAFLSPTALSARSSTARARDARFRMRVARRHAPQMRQGGGGVEAEQLAHDVPANEEIVMVEKAGDGREGRVVAELAQQSRDHLDSRSAVVGGAAADIGAGRGVIFDAERRPARLHRRLQDDEVARRMLDDEAVMAAVDDEDLAVGDGAGRRCGRSGRQWRR